MEQNSNRLSRLMKLSWDIQKGKHKTRSKALQAAWAIISNEDVTIFYLVRRLSPRKPVTERVLRQFSLFTQHQ